MPLIHGNSSSGLHYSRWLCFQLSLGAPPALAREEHDFSALHWINWKKQCTCLGLYIPYGSPTCLRFSLASSKKSCVNLTSSEKAARSEATRSGDRLNALSSFPPRSVDIWAWPPEFGSATRSRKLWGYIRGRCLHTHHACSVEGSLKRSFVLAFIVQFPLE